MLDNLNSYFAVYLFISNSYTIWSMLCQYRWINIEAPIFCFSLFDEIELHITENYVMTHAKGIVQMIDEMHLQQTKSNFLNLNNKIKPRKVNNSFHHSMRFWHWLLFHCLCMMDHIPITEHNCTSLFLWIVFMLL